MTAESKVYAVIRRCSAETTATHMQQCDRFTLCVDKKGAAGAAFKDSHAEEEGELSKHHLLTQACALFSTYP